MFYHLSLQAYLRILQEAEKSQGLDISGSHLYSQLLRRQRSGGLRFEASLGK
jgi:hypothetical protein